MKPMIHKTSKTLMLLFAAILFITACKKNEEEKLDPPRLFKASDISISAGENSAKIKWGVPLFASSKAVSYTVDFSVDETFANIAYTKVVDTAGITVTDENLAVRVPYYARIKTNAFEGQPESKYIISSTFQITGTQYFLPVKEVEIKETSVSLHFMPIAGLSAIILKPATGTPINITLSPTDVTAGKKEVTGLTAATAYTLDLFLGTKNVGYANFTTLPTTTYTTTLSSGGDLSAAITAAANGAIIGLNDGSYNISTAIAIAGKTITITSINHDPSLVKVNFKGFTLVGTGAGIIVNGVDLDGSTYAATYFADLTSAGGNTTPATFNTIVAENSYIHNIGTGIIRGDRFAGYVMGDMVFKNTKIYDVTGSSSYYLFHLDKMIFKSLTVNQCTMYNFPLGLVNCKTTLSTAIPTINITASTLNNCGTNSGYVLLNAAANPVNFNMTNSIITNVPRAGDKVAGTILSSGVGSAVIFSFNNYFNLITTAGGTALTIPATTSSNNQTVNMGWTAATTNFTLPTSSVLKTASSTGGVIGDPRWAY